jgi:hypothetical protein
MTSDLQAHYEASKRQGILASMEAGKLCIESLLSRHAITTDIYLSAEHLTRYEELVLEPVLRHQSDVNVSCAISLAQYARSLRYKDGTHLASIKCRNVWQRNNMLSHARA